MFVLFSLNFIFYAKNKNKKSTNTDKKMHSQITLGNRKRDRWRICLANFLPCGYCDVSARKDAEGGQVNKYKLTLQDAQITLIFL